MPFALFAIITLATPLHVGARQLFSARPASQRDQAVAEALRLRRQGDNEGAFEVLRQASVALPDDPIVLLDLGIQAESMQRLTIASKALHAALLLEPDNEKTMYALARVEIDQQHFPEAESHLTAYLLKRPGDASAHYGLGHLYQMQQQLEKATAQFRQSIQLQPVQTESYYQLGQMALDAHRDDEARSLFAKVLTRMAAHGGALTGMGVIAYREKSYAAARAYLADAVTASPDYQPAHYYLGLTLARLQRRQESQRELQKAADLASAQQGKGNPVSAE